MIQNFPILFGQIFGFLIVILILILKGINGSGGDSSTIYTSLFWIAQDMVIFAKFIRGGMYQLMIIFTILFSIILFYYSRKISDSITKNYIIFLGSILSNVFLCFSIIFLLLNEWFFFGALVTVPFFIGCGLVISSLMQNIAVSMQDAYQSIKKGNLLDTAKALTRKSNIDSLRAVVEELPWIMRF